MKKLLVLILSLWVYTSASAQKVYFVYLESGNNMPFYVRTTDKVYSSSTWGYLILSNLADSNYTVFVGFPSTQTKETKFILNINGSDRGFAIKQTNDGLNLVDLQNSNTVRSVQDPAGKNVRYEERSDAFTSLLSKAANDSSLLLMPVFVKVEPPKAVQKENAIVRIDEPTSSKESKSIETDATQHNLKPVGGEVAVVTDTFTKSQADSIKVSSESALADGKNTADEAVVKELSSETSQSGTNHSSDVDSNVLTSVPMVEDYKKSSIRKHSESSTSEGFGLVFFDTNGESVDTIRLLIPNPKIQFKEEEVIAQVDKPLGDVKADSLQASSEKEGLAADSVGATIVHPNPGKNEVATVAPKGKCTTLATDNDFFKLRRNMAAEETDEAMVEEAKRYFKSKCYTTEQVKNLSALFLTSAGKYLFFDAAYLYVSDQERFPSLQSEIKDDYYLRRFKALIGE